MVERDIIFPENKLPYRNQSLDIEKRIDDLLNRLTLEEKLKLLGGNRFFSTQSIKRLGISPFKMTDGPLGISMQSSFFRKNTRFPGGICLASTFNRNLAHEFGKAVGNEARAIGRQAVLAPGINIQRTPFCGRTFEYFSEDPFLTREIAIPYVKGLQSQRVAACVKHYIANNQETNRFTVDAKIDQRTLHEIYLRAFKDVITEAWMVMAAYNKVNGDYTFASKKLLHDILWKEWKFRGFIVSDWYALSRADPPVEAENCILAGVSLEMPKADVYKLENLRKAYNEKKITDKNLSSLIKRLLRVMFLVGNFDDKNIRPKGQRNTPEHQELARKMAEQGIVLLKNKDNILPLDLTNHTKIAVLGPNKDKKFGKWLYGGSSAVKPPYEITPLKGLKEKCKGNIKIISEPSEADYAIIFAGLNHDSNRRLVVYDKKVGVGHDSEGTDRNRLDLPEDQIQLINHTVQQNPRTIVVLLNGSPIAMEEWLEDVPAVLEAWYPGMEGGRAIANVIFGEINPSGRLPITFPQKISDSPAHKSNGTFPGEDLKVSYDEGIFIGYRHFDKYDIEPLFPFGYGLSYTSFEYENIRLNNKKISKNESLTVSTDIVNTGEFFGSDVVQIYIQDVESSVDRPIRELIGFEKVHLSPNQTITTEIKLRNNDFAFYDVKTQSWKIESGEYKVFIGSSSRDMHLHESFEYI